MTTDMTALVDGTAGPRLASSGRASGIQHGGARHRRDVIAPSSARSMTLLIAAGLVAGVAAKLGDRTTWRWLSDLGTYPAVWAFALVLIACYSSSALTAVVRSVAFSGASVIAYYAWSAWVLEYGVRGYPFVWLVVACTLAPAMTLIVWSGPHTPIPSWIVAGPTAALMLAEGPLRQYWNDIYGGLPDGFGFHPVQALVEIILAAATIGLLTQTKADRAKAVALTIPMVWVAEWGLGVVQSAVGT